MDNIRTYFTVLQDGVNNVKIYTKVLYVCVDNIKNVS